MLCKVTLGVLKGASKLNVLLLLLLMASEIDVKEKKCIQNITLLSEEQTDDVK